MKKFLSLALAMLLMLVPCASAAGIPYEKYDALIGYLEAGNYEQAFMEVARLASAAGADGSAEAQPSGNADGMLTPDTDGNEWRFRCDLINETGSTLSLQEVQIVNILNGNTVGDPFIFSGDALNNIALGSLTLASDESIDWHDSHPVVPDFNARDYIFIFADENGNPVEMVFPFDMSGSSGSQAQSSGNADGKLTPDSNGSDWMFHCDLINDSDSVLSLQEVQIVNILNGNTVGAPFIFSGDALNTIGLGSFALEPGHGVGWDDGHPVVPDFNARDYIFIFADENGAPVEMVFPFDMSDTSVEQQPNQQEASGDWHFQIILTNDGDSAITLQKLLITDKLNGAPIGEPYVFAADQLGNIGLGGIELNPGDIQAWNDGHPVVSDFNFREYTFIFYDANGNEVVQSFPFELSSDGTTSGDISSAATDYSQDSGKDLLTLRHDAGFSAEVAPDVFWVPANVLGESRYTNAEIYAMLSSTPEEKQANISTLYEALQLYQIGGFYSSDDNQRIYENGVNWEHHKPGYDAVRTNTGCCATDSNWLNYILAGDYEEIGYIATSQRDGNGHIYNYLKHGDWYYFIDLTHYRTDWIATAVENGDMDAYFRSDFVLGNIHRSTCVEFFVNYVLDSLSDPPGLMFQYTAENCLAVDSAQRDNGTVIIYEDAPDVNVQIIFDSPDDQLTCEFVTPPQNLPDWSQCQSYVFP